MEMHQDARTHMFPITENKVSCARWGATLSGAPIRDRSSAHTIPKPPPLLPDRRSGDTGSQVLGHSW